MHCQPIDSVKHHKTQRSPLGSKHRQSEEDQGLSPGTLQCLEFGKMKHSDRKVTKKDIEKEGAARKEENWVQWPQSQVKKMIQGRRNHHLSQVQ